MTRSRTFAWKLGWGFATTVALTLVLGAVSLMLLHRNITMSGDLVEDTTQDLIDVEKLQMAAERMNADGRSFVLSRDARHAQSVAAIHEEAVALVASLRKMVHSEEERIQVEQIQKTELEYHAAVARVMESAKDRPTVEASLKQFEEEVQSRRGALDQKIAAFLDREVRSFEAWKRSTADADFWAYTILLTLLGLIVVAAVVVSILLVRTLTRQLTSAIQNVQSSSSELEASANQQATGAKETATAVSEITTTISELLASSKQISESAQRVAQIAGETATGARSGDQTIQKAQELVGGIKRQVDVIVNQMLDLGRKSQRIGGVLEIINELAEQTNILAINATIEAAGAGEFGKRFSVVAEEIRRLADRVGGFTKEIRELVEETRAAVNATVMATESGSKAVDAGERQFADVTSSFKQIAGLVSTTSEAVREIELSTRQQATAVEQVNAAIADVAQATRETEASSSQTLQTATQLTTLSRNLSALVKASTNGSV